MRAIVTTAVVSIVALAVAGCGWGSEGISVSNKDPDYNGAVLFATHCSGCHTLSAAGAQGTGNRASRVQGPNLDGRRETHDDALYAIRNGGFSGAIMPQNIVLGTEAEDVANFVARYSGSDIQGSTGGGGTSGSGGATQP